MDDINDKLIDLHIEEKCQWLSNDQKICSVADLYSLDELCSWQIVGASKSSLIGEHKFCAPSVLDEFLAQSRLLCEIPADEILSCRKRSNPFEAIDRVFFVNRAAPKFANIDAHVQFTRLAGPNEILLFADIGGGTGGFADYILWRKGWHAKGYGITSKAGNTPGYNFSRFASMYDSFDTYFGSKKNGNTLNRSVTMCIGIMRTACIWWWPTVQWTPTCQAA